MSARIVLLSGDGIGPEVVAAGRRVLERVFSKAELVVEFDDELIGGAAIDATGMPLPPATLEAARKANAILLGAVGGPKWEIPGAKVRPEQGLLSIRKALGLFANLRPVRVTEALADASPLKRELVIGCDILFVRELTGGLYFGEPRIEGDDAVDTMRYQRHEVERVVRLAFSLAQARRRKVTSVDKANVLATSRLWRKVANEIGAQNPDITLEHQLVDSTAMRLLTHASTFDVIVTENLFGDILTDEAAALTGSLGMLPSASLGEGTRGLYEPIHGSAPDIAGKGIANPLGTILSSAMLLRLSFGREDLAQQVERAVEQALNGGARTPDLGGTASTEAVTEAVLSHLG
jgi:3-isopropylmalate dehydrogenase